MEIDIRALQQNSMTIQEFYSAMSNLWDQLALTEPAELQVFKPYTDRREQQRLVQFLMALRDDFEGLQGLFCIITLFQVLIKWLMSC